VALHRRAIGVLVGVLAAATIALQLAWSITWSDLTGSAGPTTAAVIWLQLIAVTVAMVTGVLGLAALVSGDWRRSRSSPGRGPLLSVLGLLLLSPVCAEYLAAYDSSTGNALELLAGLVVFVPLYGCAALVIREVARRRGLGWPGIVLLGIAFGLLQAGVVDQSLFSPDYRGLEGWSEDYRSTLIPGLGLSAFYLLNFVGGHAIFSVCAPIALVEAASRSRATKPWLHRGGLALTALAYVTASVLVLSSHLRTEVHHASRPQLVGSLLMVAVLVVLGLRPGRQETEPAPRRAPGVRVTALVTALLSLGYAVAPEDWGGAGIAALVLITAAIGIAWAARSSGWGVRQVTVLAAAPLIVRGVLAFTYNPMLGEVALGSKLAHNTVMLAIVLAATTIALRRTRAGSSPETGSGTAVHGAV
jgi:hypothetical protein